MSSLEGRVSLYNVTTTTLLARLDLVEAVNSRLRTELRTIRSILTSNVALRDRMVLLEQLSAVGVVRNDIQLESAPLLQ